MGEDLLKTYFENEIKSAEEEIQNLEKTCHEYEKNIEALLHVKMNKMEKLVSREDQHNLAPIVHMNKSLYCWNRSHEKCVEQNKIMAHQYMVSHKHQTESRYEEMTRVIKFDDLTELPYHDVEDDIGQMKWETSEITPSTEMITTDFSREMHYLENQCRQIQQEIRDFKRIEMEIRQEHSKLEQELRRAECKLKSPKLQISPSRSLAEISTSTLELDDFI